MSNDVQPAWAPCGSVLAKTKIVSSVASSRPGVAQLKQVVAKAIAWDLRHLASEVSRVNQRLVRALELLDDRVRALEESALGAGVALPPELMALSTGALVGRGPQLEEIERW